MPIKKEGYVGNTWTRVGDELGHTQKQCTGSTGRTWRLGQNQRFKMDKICDWKIREGEN